GESKHHRVDFQAGYGSEERLRGEVQYRHLNFLGGGRTGSVRGRWSALERGVWVDFNQPYFFANSWSFTATGQNRYIREPKFEQETIGGRAQVTYKRYDGGAL